MTDVAISYTAVMRTPRIKPLLAAGMIGRLAYGIVPFSIVVAVAQRHGFGLAGTASAAFMLATAVLAPARGRQVDRHGAKAVVLLTTGCVTALVFAAVLVGRAPWLFSLLLVGLAGASAAPVSPVLRTSWSRLEPDKERLQRIHTLDSTLEELTFVAAPLLTTAALGLAPPTWCIVLGAGLLAVASPMLITFGHVGKPEPGSNNGDHTAAAEGSRAARQRRRSLILLPVGQGIIVPILALGTVGGGLAVILPALAQHGGHIAAAGYGFAAFSLGGVVGGLLYGRSQSKATLRTKYLRAAGVLTVGSFALFAPGGYPVTVAAVLLAGLAVTPIFVIGYLLVDDLITPDRHTEANSWLGSGYNLGSALGSTAGGLLLAAGGLHPTTAVLVLVAALGTIAVLRLPTAKPTKA